MSESIGFRGMQQMILTIDDHLAEMEPNLLAIDSGVAGSYPGFYGGRKLFDF